MRSNMARTDSAGRVPERAAAKLAAAGLAAAAGLGLDLALALVPAQGGQEVHQRRLLVLRQALEGRRRGSGVLQRATDRALLELGSDVREVRAGAVVAVLADLVAGQTAGLGVDELALLVLGLDLHVDRVRRAGRRAHPGQVRHRGDGEDAGQRGDRPALGPALRPAVE